MKKQLMFICLSCILLFSSNSLFAYISVDRSGKHRFGRGTRECHYVPNCVFDSKNGTLSVCIFGDDEAIVAIEDFSGDEIAEYSFPEDGHWHTFYLGHLPQDAYLLTIETSFSTYCYEIYI